MRVVPLLAVLVAIATPGVAAAEEAQPIALGEVLQVSVRQNPVLELATIDVAIADAQILEAAGIDDWVLGAAGSLSLLRVYGFTNDIESFKSVDLNVSLARSLPWGGAVTIGAQSGFSNNPYTLTGDYSDSVYLTYSQALLRGRGERVSRAVSQQARIARNAAALGRQATAITVVRDIIIAYWNLAYALRDLAIRQSSLELATERLRITRAGISAGSIAETEALAVEQVIAGREEEIVGAELLVTQRSLDLRRLVGLEIAADKINLATAAPLTVTPRSFELEKLLAQAYQSSPTLAQLEELAHNAAIGVEVATDQTDPRLDGSITFGPLATHPQAVEALKDLASFKTYSVTANLTYEQSLGNHTADGATRRARANLQQTRVNQIDARLQIAAAMVIAVRTAEAASQRMAISQRAIVLSEKNIDAEKARFALGRATNFDIAQRQDELKQAQLHHALAVKDYLVATAQIEALTGELLTKYGIDLGE